MSVHRKSSYSIFKRFDNKLAKTHKLTPHSLYILDKGNSTELNLMSELAQ